MTILQQLGAQIREKRKQMGYSQELLGQFVSMDKTQISKIEKGKYKNLEKIQFVLEALEMAIVLKNEIDTIPIDAYQPLQEPIDIGETIFKDYVPGNRQISETLIWDVDKGSFDAKKSANFIVERVLERGDIEDYYALFDIFGGLEPVRAIVSRIKKLNPLCENFARATFRLLGHIGGVKTDFINYPYRPIRPLIEEEGIRMVSAEDIAAMKLAAIMNSGKRMKDFVDVAFLSTKFSLMQMMGFFAEKFPHSSVLSAEKSLLFFDDIDFSVPISLVSGKFRWMPVRRRLMEMAQFPTRVFDPLDL